MASIPSYSFAQEKNPEDNNKIPCATCSGPSPEVTQFITLSHQIIDALPKKTPIEANGAEYHVFGPRQGWIYNGILQDLSPWSILGNIVAGTLKNLDKRQSYLKATTELIGIYGIDIIKDSGLGFFVSAQQWPLIRDYQLLLDVDTLVGDKIYDIWVIWWYGKQLSNEQLNTIRTIIFNNSWEGKIFASNPTINDETTATQILSLIVRTNNRMKKVLTLGGQMRDPSITLWANKTIKISLNNIYFESLRKSYQCTKITAQACKSDMKDFVKHINNITKAFADNGPKKARDKIEQASKRLMVRSLQVIGQTDSQFFKNNIDDYTAREQELLSAQWLKKRSGRDILLGSISINGKSWKDLWDTVSRKTINIRSGSKTFYNKTVDTIDKGRNSTKNTIKWIFANKSSSTTTENNNKKDQILHNQRETIATGLDNLIHDHQETRTKALQMVSIDSQKAITQTLLLIRTLNDMLKNNIQQNLTRTCELQCSNLWGTCR